MILAQIVRGDGLLGDLAQRDDGILVALSRGTVGPRAAGQHAGAVAGDQHEFETVLDLVDAIFDGTRAMGRRAFGDDRGSGLETS